MRQRNICIAEFVGWQLDKITRRDQPARFFGLALAFSMVLLLLGCSEIRPTLDSFTDKAKPATLSQRTEKVTAYRLNLRGEPSAQSSILAVLGKEDLLTIRSQERNWIKVLTQDGMEGSMVAISPVLTNVKRPEKLK